MVLLVVVGVVGVVRHMEAESPGRLTAALLHQLHQSAVELHTTHCHLPQRLPQHHGHVCTQVKEGCGNEEYEKDKKDEKGNEMSVEPIVLAEKVSVKKEKEKGRGRDEKKTFNGLKKRNL